mmetsp:Transcript_330/g.449  ORF Transcript_330/g.449 Transcript_330/m.449 type:complete len:317 (-) Transcript_330:8-958(-)
MDAEDTPHVATVRASLLAEAGGGTGVLEGQISRLDPLLHVESGDGLLRGGDEVERLVVIGALNLVKVLGEVRQLAGLLHDGLLHEKGRLDLNVLVLTEHAHAEADQSLVELDTEALKIVSTVASDARAALHLEDAQALHDLVVAKLTELASIGNDLSLRLTESAHNLVVILIVRDGDGRVDDVTDLAEKLLGLGGDILKLLLLLLDLLVEAAGFASQFGHVCLLVSLLRGGDLLGNVTLLLAHVVKLILGCSLLGIEFLNLIDDALVGESGTLRCLDLLGVATSVRSQMVDINGHSVISLFAFASFVRGLSSLFLK